MQTAAAYIRVSTDDQLEYSPDSQLDRIREYAKAHNLLLPEEYIFRESEGISGRKAEKRPEFLRMIAAAKQTPKPFDVILVWKFSRFARNREDSIVYKSMLRRQCGIDVVSISEPVGDDKMSVLMEAMIEAMDEYYSLNLGEEARRGMKKKFETGGIVSGAPFGYIVENGRFVIDEETAPVVREVFSLFVSGHGYREIAQRLNDRGILTKRQSLWENRTVEYLLRNPVYIGKLRWNPEKRTARDFDNPNIQVVPGIHEPIISQDIFDQAQLRVYQLKQAHPYHAREKTKYDYMLRGLVKCSNCGRTLSAHRSRGIMAVQCIGYAHGKCKVSHHIAVTMLDLMVLVSCRRFLKSGNFQLHIRRAQSADTTAIKLEIARHEEMLHRAKEAYIAGVDTLAEYMEYKSRLSEEIERLKAKMPQEKPIDEEKVRAAFREKALGILDQIESTDDPKEQNNMLRMICEKIIFDRTKYLVDVLFYVEV